jgi:ABC-type transport system involved in multi-copper enzyme maturation permease subunit
MTVVTPQLGQVPAGHYRFRQVARMEWIKLRSLRSTTWTLLATLVGMIGIGILVMANTRAPGTAADRASFDPTNNVLAGVALGQLLIGVLGVLVMTGEYSSGMIRSTLAAIPNRPLLLAAKAAVFGAVTLAVGEAVTFVAFLAGRAVLGAGVPQPTFGQPGVLRAVAMSGVYLCLIGLMGLGLGTISRHTAGGIGALVSVLFVVPLLLAGAARGPQLAKFFPTFIAGNSMGVSKPVAEMLSPWTGFALLLVYTAVVLGTGGWLLARRDP